MSSMVYVETLNLDGLLRLFFMEVYCHNPKAWISYFVFGNKYRHPLNKRKLFVSGVRFDS